MKDYLPSSSESVVVNCRLDYANCQNGLDRNGEFRHFGIRDPTLGEYLGSCDQRKVRRAVRRQTWGQDLDKNVSDQRDIK